MVMNFLPSELHFYHYLPNLEYLLFYVGQLAEHYVIRIREFGGGWYVQSPEYLFCVIAFLKVEKFVYWPTTAVVM